MSGNVSSEATVEAVGQRPVIGNCPACGGEALKLGSTGHVYCSLNRCPDPHAPSRLLSARVCQATASDTDAELRRRRVDAVIGTPYSLSDAAPDVVRSGPVTAAPAPAEAVDHPAHYGGADDPLEPIKLIEAMGWGEPFCLGNALKYRLRAGRKPGESAELDLRKAAWYEARARGEQP